MASSIFALLFLCLGGAGISGATERSMERSVTVSAGILICWLYLCYCAQLLWAGVALYCAAAAGLFLYCCRRGGRSFLKGLFTPGFALWLVMCAIFLGIFSRNSATLCDELRLWAAVPKAMHELGTLQLGADAQIFTAMQSYPPGLTLALYYFTAFSGEFSEGALYVGYTCLTMAFLMPAFEGWQWRKWRLLAPAGLAVYALPFVFTSHFGDSGLFGMSLFVDPLLGIAAGYAFFLAARSPLEDWVSLAHFSLTLMLVTLLKSTGTVFALCALACALLSAQKPGWRWLIPAAALAAGYGSWKLLLNAADIHDLIPLNLHLLDGEELGNLLGAMTSINVVGYSLPVGPLLSFSVIYPLLWLIFALTGTFLHRGRHRQEAAAAACMLAAAMAFLYGYAAMYARSLASFPRYMATLLLCLVTYLTLRELPLLREETLSRRITPGAAKGLAALCLVIALGVTAVWQYVFIPYQELEQADSDAEQLRQAVLADEGYRAPARVYLVMAGDGEPNHRYHQRMFLKLISRELYLCNPIFEIRVADPNVADPVESWAEDLKGGVDYVYVLTVEETLAPVFLEFCDEAPTPKTLYRVLPADNALGVCLIPA